MIYFIQAGKKGAIKIGYTDKPVEERLYSLQTASAEQLFILGTIDGTKKEEKLIHKKYHIYQIRNEWFQPGEALLKFINYNCGEEKPIFDEFEYFENGESLDSGLEMIEIKYIKKALIKCGGNITKSAELLNISFRSLRYRIDKHNINFE